MKNISHQPLSSPFLGICTTIGFAGALVMGVLSWLLLLMIRDLSIILVLLFSLISFITVAFLFLRNCGSHAPRIGAFAGLIAGLASIVFLGSLVVVQPQTLAELESQNNQFSASGVMLGLGLIAFLAGLGWVAGTLAKGSEPSKDTDWRSRFVKVTAASYLPLIAVGGLVTSTESGLAVPDSVTTYGSIGILFPLSLMDETRIYLEHTHRIFGMFAGIATIVLVIRMIGAPSRMLPRIMSILLLIGVIIQGLMGALRVSEESQGLASIHGILAQLVFAFAVSTGVVCSRRWASVTPSDEGIGSAKSTRLLLILTTIGLCIQLVFGSLTRHLDSGHALMSHIGFSFIVVVLVIISGAKCIRVGKLDPQSSAIRPYGMMMHLLVILQFTLGWGALAMTQTGEEGHPELPTADELATAAHIRVPETIITSSHHLIGALLLASVVAALAWSIKIASRPKTQS
ncbi:MAG: COX15/CtaA family protein [Phycisphaerales bacterium]